MPPVGQLKTIAPEKEWKVGLDVGTFGHYLITMVGLLLLVSPFSKEARAESRNFIGALALLGYSPDKVAT